MPPKDVKKLSNEELAADDDDEIYDYYKYATQERFNFLYVDTINNKYYKNFTNLLNGNRK
jgi:hypothetical protein